MYGKDILCGISKVPFEIPHNISYPYIERSAFYSQVEELLDLRARKPFWNAPLMEDITGLHKGEWPTTAQQFHTSIVMVYFYDFLAGL